MKGASSIRFLAVFSALAAVPAASAAGTPSGISWEDGGFSLRHWSAKRITPSILQGGRRIVFAYRTDGTLETDGRRVNFTTVSTNVFVRLEKTPDGLCADYVQTLVVRDGEKDVPVGIVSNSLVAAESRVKVTSTAYPFHPGRYRFVSDGKTVQVVVFDGFRKSWTGGIIETTDRAGRLRMNRLGPEREFSYDAWGLNRNQIGGQRIGRIGFVPDVWEFIPDTESQVMVNRYAGGFEMTFSGLNPMRRLKPLWTEPETLRYTIRVVR